MSTLLERIVSSAFYLGQLELNADDTMTFTTPHKKKSGQRNRKFFYELGDIVYFMFVEGQLMKIGKAARGGGWYGRMGTYEQGIRGDMTNKMIIAKMHDMKKTKIDIIAVKTPRVKTSITCPILNETTEVEIETAIEVERMLTNKYLAEMNLKSLPFCSQIS